MLFGDVHDVAGVDLRSVTYGAIIVSGRFGFDHVDAVEHVDVMDVDIVSHQTCQEAC